MPSFFFSIMPPLPFNEPSVQAPITPVLPALPLLPKVLPITRPRSIKKPIRMIGCHATQRVSLLLILIDQLMILLLWSLGIESSELHSWDREALKYGEVQSLSPVSLEYLSFGENYIAPDAWFFNL